MKNVGHAGVVGSCLITLGGNATFYRILACAETPRQDGIGNFLRSNFSRENLYRGKVFEIAKNITGREENRRKPARRAEEAYRQPVEAEKPGWDYHQFPKGFSDFAMFPFVPHP